MAVNKPNDAFMDAGFAPVTAERRRRLIVCSRAKEKHGKTHFAMTAPGPFAYIDYDQGTEGVLEKFVEAGAEIYKCDLPKPLIVKAKITAATDKERERLEKVDLERRVSQYDDYWVKGRNAFVAGCDNKRIKTVIVDTASEFYEALCLARFGRLTQVMPFMYGPVKQDFRDVLRLAFGRDDLNVFFINKMKKEYKENSKGDAVATGKMEMKGFDDLGYIAQVVITHLRKDIPGGGVIFGIRIDDCRANPDCIGVELWSDDGMCDFPNLAMTVFPDTVPEDWQ